MRFLVLGLLLSSHVWAAPLTIFLGKSTSQCLSDQRPAPANDVIGVSSHHPQVAVVIPLSELKLRHPDALQDAGLILRNSKSQRLVEVRQQLRAQGGHFTLVANLPSAPKDHEVDRWSGVVSISSDFEMPIAFAVARISDQIDVTDRDHSAHGCFHSLPSRIISPKYYNSHPTDWRSVTYSTTESESLGRGFGRSVGVVDFEVDPAPGGGGMHNAPSSSYVKFYTSKEYQGENQSQVEVQRDFELAPRMAGYIVQEELEYVFEKRSAHFDDCGRLTRLDPGFQTATKIVRSYNMMPVEPNMADDQDYLNRQLRSFKPVNTCGESNAN